MTDTNHPRPLSWLPDITKNLTPQQRAEVMQLIDLAWATAYQEKGQRTVGYARVDFGDIEAAHRELHRSVQKDINNARRRVSRRSSRLGAGE